MRPLAKVFTRHGWQFERRDRVGDVALYEKRHPEVFRPSYEVVVVQKRKEKEIAGRAIEAHEAMPSDEQWGSAGWTLRTLAEAVAKFDAVCAERKVVTP